MSGEDDFFAAPPADAGDEPIVLGGPPADDQPIFLGDAPPQEEPPTYLGDVNDAPPVDDDDAPIVLGASGEEESPPPEPTGPSPMQKWNEEWQATLLERKDAENARKAELMEAAKIAIEQFQSERDTRREAKMAKNREDEQAKLEAIEADLDNDNSWQRVCKLVELSHDSSKQAQDVKRMRDVLIYLKNEQPKAEALS